MTKNRIFENDIISEMMRLVARMLPIAENNLEQKLLDAEKSIRSTWGGDRVYIPRRCGEVDARLRSERNARIWRAWQQGRQIAWLEKTENLSRKQITRIIADMRNLPNGTRLP